MVGMSADLIALSHVPLIGLVRTPSHLEILCQLTKWRLPSWNSPMPRRTRDLLSALCWINMKSR